VTSIFSGLSDMWFVVTHLPQFLWYSLISLVNLLVAGLAKFVQALLDGIGISMPAPPTVPSTFTDVLSWVAWVFPIGTVADIAVFYAAAWLMWFVVSIGLRWARAAS
jgi:hypothetical protein